MLDDEQIGPLTNLVPGKTRAHILNAQDLGNLLNPVQNELATLAYCNTTPKVIPFNTKS